MFYLSAFYVATELSSWVMVRRDKLIVVQLANKLLVFMEAQNFSPCLLEPISDPLLNHLNPVFTHTFFSYDSV